MKATISNIHASEFVYMKHNLHKINPSDRLDFYRHYCFKTLTDPGNKSEQNTPETWH